MNVIWLHWYDLLAIFIIGLVMDLISRNKMSKIYQLNSSGMVLNPSCEVLYKANDHYVAIAYAEHEGKWQFGFRVITPVLNDSKFIYFNMVPRDVDYHDRPSCRKAAIQQVINNLEDSPHAGMLLQPGFMEALKTEAAK